MINKEKYTGKYFSVLGDSLSTLEGYSKPDYAAFYDTARKLEAEIYTPADTWWGQVINALGGQLLCNNSISGSTVSDRPSYEIASYGASRERTFSLTSDGICPDVIMVLMGTNDWGMGVDIYPENADDIYSFAGAYSIMLARLKECCPEAEVWCATLPVSTCTRMEDFKFPYCYGGKHISKYCEAIRRCAKDAKARLIELYTDATPYDTIDGFHPTAQGMRTISDRVMAQLSEEG